MDKKKGTGSETEMNERVVQTGLAKEKKLTGKRRGGGKLKHEQERMKQGERKENE